MLTFLSAIMWGLWWIPIRLIESMGLTGAQASFLCNLGAVILLAAFIAARRLSARIGPKALLGAFLIALAFTLYSIAITLSDVVRVILLFYLAPAWSKIIEWAFLRMPWQRSSWLTLGLSLIGAYLVLGGDLSLASLNIGDLMALAAGVSWAIGAALIFTGRRAPVAALTLATVGWGALQSAFFVVILGETLSDAAGIGALGLSLALGAAYLVPVIGMTLWGALRLAPALLSFLFTLEIVSGVISAAILLDEPFGLWQALGGTLIFAAAIFEAVMTLRAPPAAPSRA
ncbi:DMT family transporter [Roseovarius aquimarinus]|uniref:DMT family transporter n=1 Tax=Roseovarius aquimarinus TaxID=1229156 RepID=A0ABW7IAN5_9RHOB